MKNSQLVHLQIPNHQIEHQTNSNMNHQEIIHHDILNNEVSMRKVRECDVGKVLLSLTYTKQH